VPCHRIVQANGVGSGTCGLSLSLSLCFCECLPFALLHCQQRRFAIRTWDEIAEADVHEQYIGGFMGDWNKVPSGVNCARKRERLKQEGVLFDEKGKLKDKSLLWSGFEV
jgi:hypothetical protein